MSTLVKAAAAAAIALSLGSLAIAAPANAAARDGYCNPAGSSSGSDAEICLYYNLNRQGSLHDEPFDAGNVANLSGKTFLSSGAGQGQKVINNSASGWNRYLGDSVRLYADKNFSGRSFLVGYEYTINFDGFVNVASSYRWTE